MYFYNMTMIINNTANNRGGGVFAQRSNILLYNDIQIMNNTANRGGGIFLKRTTTDQLKIHSITLYSPVNVIIINNTAKDQGGGMFIHDELYDISFCNEVTSVVTNCPFKINITDIDFYKTT